MSDQVEISELDSLKQYADNLGVKYHPSVGLDKLKEKIEEHKAKQEKAEPLQPNGLSPKAVLIAKKRKAAKEELTKLRRVVVTCMNPNKKEWPGEYFTFSNKFISVKRMVPFGHEWHIEQCLYDMLKSKKYRVEHKRKGPDGNPVVTQRMVPEFGIVDLEPLTKEELEQLAADQSARNAIE